MPDTNTTTYDLPNYLGRLYMKGRRTNAALQLIGGINPQVQVRAKEFPVGQEYTIPSHSSSRARLEGAAAPDHAGVVRTPIANVTQIFQEKVVVSYTSLAAGQQLSGAAIGGQSNPVESELDFQVDQKMELIARNLNWTILKQTYNKPSDNSAARRTRGLAAAITTNSLANGGTARELTMRLLDEAFEAIVNQGGTVDGSNLIALANTTQMRKLNELFRADKAKVDSDRMVGGVMIRTVYTAFGVFNFVLEQDLAQTEILIVNFDAVRLVGSPVDNRGIMFLEPLAKTGGSMDYQIYGEIGLDHGPEWMHAEIVDLATTFA